VTIANPASAVAGWLDAALIEPDATDAELDALMTKLGYHDPSWRHEALTALRLIRYEHETGMPF
jgi:hypothetical protein